MKFTHRNGIRLVWERLPPIEVIASPAAGTLAGIGTKTRTFGEAPSAAPEGLFWVPGLVENCGVWLWDAI